MRASLKSLHRRMPLTLKMILIFVIVGGLLWTVMDSVMTRSITLMFKEQLTARLNQMDQDYRMRFSRYIIAYPQAAKLVAGQKLTADYVINSNWTKEEGEPKVHRRPPQWFIPTSIQRSLIKAKGALLLDAHGRVREIYQQGKTPLPYTLRHPSDILLERSSNLAYIVTQDGMPYVFTTATISDEFGDTVGYLVIMNPLDAKFLHASQGRYTQDIIIALVQGDPPKIISSSDPARFPKGAPLHKFAGEHLGRIQSFFEYGSSEMTFKFVSFIPTQQIDGLISTFVTRNRLFWAGMAVIYILAFMLLMLTVTRRIRHLTTRIEGFSGRFVEETGERIKSGDPLVVMEDCFEQLTKIIEDRTAAIEGANIELSEKAIALQKANTRLRELDELKSTIMTSVSHDLRTPMTSILGFAKLISKDFTKNFSPLAEGDRRLKERADRIISNIGIITNEGNRLTRLINDFLDLNKIEEGRLNWNDQDIDPGKLIDDTVQAVSGEFAHKKEVILYVNKSEPLPTIKVDPDRLVQVLVNLLNNAAKYTVKGRVTVLADTMNNGDLRIQVADTGQGIPHDQLEVIFDKFHQVTNTDTMDDIPKGSGLGLNVCKKIIQHYNGRIWAESDPGKGSTFLFTIPHTAFNWPPK